SPVGAAGDGARPRPRFAEARDRRHRRHHHLRAGGGAVLAEWRPSAARDGPRPLARPSRTGGPPAAARLPAQRPVLLTRRGVRGEARPSRRPGLISGASGPLFGVKSKRVAWTSGSARTEG